MLTVYTGLQLIFFEQEEASTEDEEEEDEEEDEREEPEEMCENAKDSQNSGASKEKRRGKYSSFMV